MDYFAIQKKMKLKKIVVLIVNSASGVLTRDAVSALIKRGTLKRVGLNERHPNE